MVAVATIALILIVYSAISVPLTGAASPRRWPSWPSASSSAPPAWAARRRAGERGGRAHHRARAGVPAVQRLGAPRPAIAPPRSGLAQSAVADRPAPDDGRGARRRPAGVSRHGLASAFLLSTMLCSPMRRWASGSSTDPAVPARVRQALDVESGLNDGLAVPFFLVAMDISMADARGRRAVGGRQQRRHPDRLGNCRRRGRRRPWWIPLPLRRSSAIGSPRVASGAHPGRGADCLRGRRLLGGSGFIAAFVGGMTFGACPGARARVTSFTEEAGDLLAAVTWMGFGALAVSHALPYITWRVVLYAVLSLTVVRMLPVAVALARTGARCARWRSSDGSGRAGWPRSCSACWRSSAAFRNRRRCSPPSS